MGKWLVIIGLFSSTVSFSQQDSSYLYHFNMKYVGSNSSVDLNYQYVLESLVELFDKNPGYTLHIRGHVCCGPSQKLSNKRAKKAYKYLKRAGISADRMTYKGYSDTIPLAFPEKTEEDEAENRRVDFIITIHK